jgi:hypothetical protein
MLMQLNVWEEFQAAQKVLFMLFLISIEKNALQCDDAMN